MSRIRRPHCQVVPPYLLRRLAATDPDAAEETLLVDQRRRVERLTMLPIRPTLIAAGVAWVVHSADGTQQLPGRVVRSAGEPASGDEAVDEAAYGVTGSLALFSDLYGRSSYDDRGTGVSLTVHFGRNYENAYWDGRQLVFGDGDGQIFGRFTRAVDVLGHEFTHAVVEHTAGLLYRGQSGALNESVADVFAACLKQRLLGQSAEEADWLIGTELFLPGVAARGLRDMAAPGTAYDDPRLGRDPQPGHMDAYVSTEEDNGGVHLNSGIPNRAFQLAATAIGGSSAEGAGRIWYAALTGPDLGPHSDFEAFAAATVAAAGEHRTVVREAWQRVGVIPGAVQDPSPVSDRSAPAASRVSVRRTGGFLGRSIDAGLDLGEDDPRTPELQSLVARIDPTEVVPATPQPDMFVYYFHLCGSRVVVPEQQLTEDLRRVADLLLNDPPESGIS